MNPLLPALAGFRYQCWRMRRTFDELQAFVLAPLFTLIFVGLVAGAGRRDLIADAALGAVLVSLWNICVQVGGNIIDSERGEGTFESLSTTPAPVRAVIFGRVTAIVLISLLVLPEVWLVTAAVFGETVTVPHPVVFAVGVLLLAVGLHGAANLVAGLFVLARTSLIFQNALTYPLFVLGGLLVPVRLLPAGLQPPSRLVFLSWGSELLHTALRPADPPHVVLPRLAGLAVTAVLTCVAGQVLLGRIIERARTRGTLGLA